MNINVNDIHKTEKNASAKCVYSIQAHLCTLLLSEHGLQPIAHAPCLLIMTQKIVYQVLEDDILTLQ